MRGARLCFGLGVEGLSGHRTDLRNYVAFGGARVRLLAGADFHAGYKSRGRARREHFARASGLIGWKRTCEASARCQLGNLRARSGGCETSRDLAGGYEVRVWPAERRADLDR